MAKKTSGSIVLNLGNGAPILRYCGEYSATETYVFDQDFRDYVRQKDADGDWEYFAVAKRWDTIQGVQPIGDTKGRWQKSVELGFLKAGAITADMIDVDSLVVKHLVTENENKKVVIDNGTIQLIVDEILKVLISGDNMGSHNPTPTEISIIANNQKVAESSLSGTQNIDITLPVLNVRVDEVGSNVYVPPINVTFTRTGLPLINFVMYLGWNNQGLRDTFRQVTPTNLSYQMPPLTLTTTMDVGQTQVLTLHISGTYQAVSMQATSLYVQTSAVNNATLTIPTKKVELASDGFRAAYSGNREFLLRYENGDLLLRHRGSVDMSGALAWGTVLEDGNLQNSGGYYFESASRSDTATYTINHKIGHTNYTIIAPNCTIVSRSDDSCVISTGDSDAKFDFIILGNNAGSAVYERNAVSSNNETMTTSDGEEISVQAVNMSMGNYQLNYTGEEIDNLLKKMASIDGGVGGTSSTPLLNEWDSYDASMTNYALSAKLGYELYGTLDGIDSLLDNINGEKV